MSEIPHIPVLRLGRPYESLDQIEVRDCRSGEVRAVVSSVNAGMIRKDVRRIAEGRAALNRLPAARLVEIAAQAGELFRGGTLPLGDRGHQQSPQDYVTTLSATSGLPHNMVRRNMEKIHHALTHMGTVLNGLSRGLDLSLLDTGFGEQNGTRLAYFPAGAALGLVMPSNSPAVNSLWLPALPLKTPVIIKPGREEPWTPYRLIQAFIAAGVPAEAFGFYPTDHEGAGEILRSCGRALIFGDKQTIDKYAGDPAVQVHGPGWSKILIGEDCIDQWPDYVDLMVRSVAENGGRSCINASAIIVPRHGREIAAALARELGPLAPRAADDPEARLSAFANPKMAEFIDAQIEEGLRTPGAEDLTAAHRDGPRKVAFEGGLYLRPTIVFCESDQHPLFNREFLCPYATVVEIPPAEAVERMGYTLALSAITKDEALLARLMAAPTIERLNIGPVPTMTVSWDQPHEGNMFEFLWRRRSIERAW
ncbi:MAG: aldehyde dehydrogenase [Verrucomicrobiales bacterium]|nr:aldehyde dehydrogenase [Verrucomicrobiales bacterium]MCP5528335.1 aldehyde dehydrogenase [Verrucomicrobiales bacterium]